MTGKIPGISSPEDLDYITENVLGLDSTKFFPIILDTAPTSRGLTSKKCLRLYTYLQVQFLKQLS